MSKNRFYYLVIILFALVFMLVSCGKKSTQVVQMDSGARETQVYYTVIAQLTQEAAVISPTPALIFSPTLENTLPTPTEVSPEPTASPVLPTPPTPPTPTPQATPTPPSAPSGTRLWKSNFEGEKTWYTGTKEDSYTFEFLNGAYRIYNNLLGSIVWSIRGDSYTDIRLEVDAMRHKGPKDGYFGLICRYVDSKNYYALVMASDNTVGIVKMEKSKLSFIQQGELPARVLNEKDEYNRIRADCIGSNLIMYVNEEKIIETQDSSFSTGDVGIGVGNQLEAAGIDVLFDNFEIWQP